MAVRTILTWPNDVLAKTADTVETVDDCIVNLAYDLKDTMRSAFGIGLAAPQVGISKSLCVIDHKACKSQLLHDPVLSDVVVMINPTWSSVDETTFMWEEACLSVIGLSALVKRAGKINLRYTDLSSAIHELEITGEIAGIVQHETDHLIGKVFIDRLAKKKASQIKKRFLRQKTEARRARLKAIRKERIELLREESANNDGEPVRIGGRNKKRHKKPKTYGKNKRRKK